MPEWAVEGPGISVKITVKAENRFKRASTKTAWCHSEECAIQTLAVAKYGPASSKWPVTLAQFRTLNRAAVTKLALQTTESTDSSECLKRETVSEGHPGLFVTKKGRPKKANVMSGAERIRAYRARQKDDARDS